MRLILALAAVCSFALVWLSVTHAIPRPISHFTSFFGGALFGHFAVLFFVKK